jgi:hypothetical protein
VTLQWKTTEVRPVSREWCGNNQAFQLSSMQVCTVKMKDSATIWQRSYAPWHALQRWLQVPSSRKFVAVRSHFFACEPATGQAKLKLVFDGLLPPGSRLATVFIEVLTLKGGTIKKLAILFLFLCGLAITGQAQLPLGTVSGVAQETCPPEELNLGWVSATNEGPPATTCYSATVSCPNLPNDNLTYGVATPAGTSNGTVVFVSPSGGTQLVGGNYNTSVPYKIYHANYQTVQMQWAVDWRVGATGGGYLKSAACREATALNFFATTYYQTSVKTPTAGSCAIGWSGGAGGLAYSLTYYGASYLDKATFVSGPQYGNLVDGCVPSSPPVSICPTSDGINYPMGCNPVSGTWTEAPQYNGNAAKLLGKQIDDDPPCNVSSHNYTTQDELNLTADSIVDQAADSNFTYPQTAIAAFECDDDQTWGNSSEVQGWLYLSQFASPAQVAGSCNYPNTLDPTSCLAINRVYGCKSQEATYTGYVCIGNTCPVCSGNPPSCTCNGVACSSSYSAQTADIDDFEDPVNGCIKRH